MKTLFVFFFFVIEAITFFCNPGWRILYQVIVCYKTHIHVLNGGYQCQTTNMFNGKMALETKPAFLYNKNGDKDYTHMVQKFQLFEVVQACLSLLTATSKVDWWVFEMPRTSASHASPASLARTLCIPKRINSLLWHRGEGSTTRAIPVSPHKALVSLNNTLVSLKITPVSLQLAYVHYR